MLSALDPQVGRNQRTGGNMVEFILRLVIATGASIAALWLSGNLINLRSISISLACGFAAAVVFYLV